MRFADTLTINITAGRTIKPKESVLNAYGKDINFCINSGSLSLFDSSDNLQEKTKESAKPPELTSRLLAHFAQNIKSASDACLISSGADHLKTMALIESAYLSARTGSPESPNRILQMSQNGMTRYLFK
jgi:hypothetical protein